MVVLRQVTLIARRSIVRTMRQPGVFIPPLSFPLMLMAVNSNGLRAATHLPGFPTHSFLAFFLPFSFLQGALFASGIAGTDLARDIDTGFLNRLALTPVRGSALLLGQIGGALGLGAIQACLYLGVGLAAGVHIDAGVPGAVRERWGGGWRQFLRQNPSFVFLTLWIALPFLFFSLSQSKRPQYILPVIPAVALLIVWLWRKEDGILRGAVSAGVVLAIAGLLIATAAFIPKLSQHLNEPLVEPAQVAAVGIGLVAFVGGLLAIVFRHSRRFLVMALTLPILEIPLASNALLQAIGETRSTRTLVTEISRWVRPDTQLIAIREYEPTLTFYLHRPIDVASEDGSELTSNYMLRHFAVWSLRPDSSLHSMAWFRRELESCCPPTMFFVRTKDLPMQHTLYGFGARQIAGNDKLAVFARGLSRRPLPVNRRPPVRPRPNP